MISNYPSRWPPLLRTSIPLLLTATKRVLTYSGPFNSATGKFSSISPMLTSKLGIPPRLYAPDAFQAYAYAYAGLQAGTPQRGNSLDWIVTQSAKSLDAQQLAGAQAKAAQIYEACCHP
jgi:hypothetical protein